jgi:ribosome biogenesis protein Nip4
MDALEQFTKQFTDHFDLRPVQKIRNQYFLVDNSLAKKIPLQPQSIGLFLGTLKKDLQPSPALIDLLAKTSTKKAIIDDKAAWLFLCGRDVFPQSILKNAVSEGLVLVQNEKDENLGLGKMFKGKNGMMIRNLLDKGEYLRMER